MGNNTKERLVFAAMMTFGMVLVMCSYNVIIAVGFTIDAVLGILTHILPIFIVAFAVEMLVVNHNVKKLHKLVVSPDDPQFKHIIVMAGMMVVAMCILMSLYATLVNQGTGPHFWADYALAVGRNLPVALVAQLVVIGPLVRMIHMRMFATSTLTS